MIKVIEKSKIKTQPIFFQLNDSDSANIMVQTFDYLPLVYIKKLNAENPAIDGTTIDPKDIIYIKLHNSKFLPEIELYCNDANGILFSDLYPFDNDTILCIFAKSNTEITMPIRMDFKIIDYETQKSTTPGNKYLIRGILNIDDLHFARYEMKKGTSYEVIKKIATDMNLGFASNIEKSNDDMKWLSFGDTYIDVFKNITKYAYISDDSFIWTFIDFYYNLNYVDIQLESGEFLKEQSSIKSPFLFKEDSDNKLTDNYLTNNDAFNTTNKYITKFEMTNQSTDINLKTYYTIKTTWYDKNKNTIFKVQPKELITDGSKLGSTEGKLKDLTDRESPLFTENRNDWYTGKLDTDNVHENFYKAKIINQYNLNNFEKMKLIITLNQLNFSITRFQNIKIEIFNKNDLFSRKANDPTVSVIDNINARLSGYWYVTGINYLFRRNGGIEQEIILARRDLSIDYGKGSNQKNDLRNPNVNANVPKYILPNSQNTQESSFKLPSNKLPGMP